MTSCVASCLPHPCSDRERPLLSLLALPEISPFTPAHTAKENTSPSQFMIPAHSTLPPPTRGQISSACTDGSAQNTSAEVEGDRESQSSTDSIRETCGIFFFWNITVRCVGASGPDCRPHSQKGPGSVQVSGPFLWAWLHTGFHTDSVAVTVKGTHASG